MAIDIRLKRGLKADLPTSAPAGQPLVATNTRELFLGTGASVVKITDVVFSASIPVVDDQGKLWVDVVSNVIKRYNGSTWEALSEHVDLTPYATTVYVDGQISALTTAMEDADDLLQAAIAAEAARALAAETVLTNAVNSEVTNRENAVLAEQTARINAVAGVQTSLDAEILNRTNADTALVSDLASAATGKGASLIGVEDADGLFTATTVEGALREIRTSHTTELDALSQEISDQITANAAGDAANSAAISAEVVRATAAEAALAASIVTANGGTAAEEARALAAEAALQTQISNRYTKAEVDTKISDLIDGAPAAFDTLNEIANQLAADGTAATAIVNALAAETARATAAEAAVAADLVTETAARVAAEAAINATAATFATITYVDSTFFKLTDVLDGGSF